VAVEGRERIARGDNLGYAGDRAGKTDKWRRDL
jgi:hypothetical protein